MGTVVRRRSNAVTEEAIAARRVEILRSTASVIVNSGLSGCSFGAVSDATGFSVGMIQHYFRTRDKLIEACVEHRMEESEAEWRQIASRDGEADAARKLRGLIDYAVMGEKDFTDAWGFWFELYAAARLDPSLAEKVNDRLRYWQRLFTEAIQDALDSGQAVTDRTVEDVVNSVLGLTDGLAFQAINGTFGMTVPRMHAILHSFVESELKLPRATAGVTVVDYH